MNDPTYAMIEPYSLIPKEKVIPMSKRKPIMSNRRAKEEVNKKAIIWTGSILLVVIITMTLLIILDK
ncbi:MAG: hypothetical protein K0Q73_3257 [Paenibacillus sp.]|jgi:hypothetical protein|nr:hypothetical protein [Paenibacillus sp.]